MTDDTILSARIGRLQTNQQRTFLFGVELELQLVHPRLQRLDFVTRGFLVVVLAGEIRIQVV